MNSQLSRALSSLLDRLLTVRLADFRDDSGRHEFLRVQGYLAALENLGVITWDQLCMFTDLLLNASQHAGEPFPCALNAGPVMPFIVAYKRRYAPHGGQVKPSARVPADERPSEVPAPASRPELRLLCLLVKDRDGKARSLPVHTMRPMPPRVLRAGRWSLEGDPALELSETHAVRPTAEVLERCARQRQAHALRPATRAFSVGGVSHVA